MEITAQQYIENRKRTFIDYSQISNVDLIHLRDFLNEEIERALDAEETTTTSLKLHSKIKVEYNKDLTLRCAFFFVDSHYFDKREAVSLNADGFIGLCGWADSKNSLPFQRAFERWVGTITTPIVVRRMETVGE